MWKPLLLFLLVPQALFGDDIEMTVSLSKTEVVQFEPVVLKVSATNVSGKPQEIVRSFDLTFGYLSIFFIDPEGKTRRWMPGAIAKVMPEYMTLSTNRIGDSVCSRIMLISAPDDWMDKPGKYQLYVIFRYNEGKQAESPKVELTVKKATEINKKALKRFRGFPQAMYLINMTTSPVIGLEFEAVIREYPESVYTPWCYYVLGRATQYREDLPEQVRATRSREFYETLLKKYPKFSFKIEVEYEMSRELFRLGKPDEAIREIEKLIETHKSEELFLFWDIKMRLSELADEEQQDHFMSLPAH